MVVHPSWYGDGRAGRNRAKMSQEIIRICPTDRDRRELAAADRDRSRLAERYRQVRVFTDKLCEPLATEDYVVQSMPDASPAKWHLAHTSWFFETFVLERVFPQYRPHPQYAFLFNSYYNAVGPMHCRPRRGLISRPTVADTRRYRNEIDDWMMRFFEDANHDDWRALEPVVELGLNHEQQHQELLLTDIKHLLAQNPLYPPYQNRPSDRPGQRPIEAPWVEFDEGLRVIGHSGDGFCFDNECPQHRVFLERFSLAPRLVTNLDYLAFVEDGGYERPEFWLSLGWVTRTEQRWEAPLYWEKRAGDWFCFTLSGLRPLEPAEPVCHVSYFEADAYARWAGARLPSEAEWEVASADLPLAGNFAERSEFHPVPVQAPSGTLDQMFGDLWEWTRSSYSPYPGYRPPAGALGEYNGKFMCNQYVLRGGSCATAQSHIRRTYRNFFAPDKRWQFMGIRLAKDPS